MQSLYYFSRGFLKKLRKEGKIYLGSKWQKRYCVVRNHILYYFREKKSTKQAGHILLPGYKAQLANKKGREFTLTHSEGHRTYQVHIHCCLLNRQFSGAESGVHYTSVKLKSEATKNSSFLFHAPCSAILNCLFCSHTYTSVHPSTCAEYCMRADSLKPLCIPFPSLRERGLIQLEHFYILTT